jgi:tetratricopeptide (TPR) repeat protein
VRKTSLYLLLTLLGAACFSLATCVQPRAMVYSQGGQDSTLKILLGDGRRIFANHFFTKADVYYHSGFYPSIFDQGGGKRENHLTAHEENEGPDHEEEATFLERPRDFIEAFGRHFMITEHTHLSHGQEREILPWLKLSAELDPQLLETYTVGAYWLGSHLNKPKEAEEFLRDGLRANPHSYQILFALGQLLYKNDHDLESARNVLELALQRWHEQHVGAKDPDNLSLEQITVNLAELEEKAGNIDRALDYLEEAKKVSRTPYLLQKQIDDLKNKRGSPHP